MTKYIFTGFLVFMLLPLSVNARVAMVEDTTKSAVFAAGCFWCIEKDFEKIAGVKSVVSGYTGGVIENPTYKQVGTQKTGHYEAVKVTYDSTIVSYEDLLNVFWKNHDPFDPIGQFCDKGASYRAAIFVETVEQKAAAEASLDAAQEKVQIKIATPVLELKPFYLAEDYHQDYYKKNPIRYKYYRWNCGRDKRLEDVRKALKSE